jgi:hypothetical protein
MERTFVMFPKDSDHLQQNNRNYFISMAIGTYIRATECEAKLCTSLAW